MNRLIRNTLCCALALGSASSFANLVTNGNFEAGFSGTPNYRYLYNDNHSVVPGWVTLDDGIGEPSYIFDSTAPEYQTRAVEGRYAIALNQGTGLRTFVNLLAGQSYALHFYAKWVTNLPVDPLQVSIDGNGFTVVPNGYETLVFTANTTGTGAALEFRNPSPIGNYRGYAFDDVSLIEISAVPEPASLVMMLTGLIGLFGIKIRQSRLRL